MPNTAKKEAIRKAYGELYEVMKENINHTTGSYLIESTHFYDKDNLYKRELFDVREYSESLLVITPKSIQGIENNNGWIRINSDNDLPKNQLHGDLFEIGLLDDEGNFTHERKRCSGKSVKWMWDKKLITHYQPIVKPEKPIY